MNDEKELPPISSVPSDQHGQIMFVLGQLMGEVKGVQQRQDMTNGKVLKAGADIEVLKQDEAARRGSSKGVSRTGLIAFNVVTLIILAVTLYLKLIK